MSASPALPPAQVLRAALLAAIALLALIYFLDFTWYQIRLHFPRAGAAAGSVHRLRVLAIPGKANKVEYQIDELQPEEDIPCTRTILPVSSSRPCWYVARHANDPIPM